MQQPLPSMGGLGPGLLAPPLPAGGLPPNLPGGFPPPPGGGLPPLTGLPPPPQNFVLSPLPPGATQGGFQLGGCGPLPNFGAGGLTATLGPPPGMPGTGPLGPPGMPSAATQMAGGAHDVGGASNSTLAALLGGAGGQPQDSLDGGKGLSGDALQRSGQPPANESRNARQEEERQNDRRRRGDQREQEIREARERMQQAEAQKCHLHKKAKPGCKFCKKHQELLDTAKDKANELAGRAGRDGRRRGRRPDRAISEDREAEGRRGPLELANSKTFGFSGLLQTHVVECAHFKSLLSLETFEQLVDETYQFANSVEPYMANSGTLPSALFCCLYRFFTMGLDGRMLRRLIDSQESPYIRCCGFLYVRFGLPHEQVLSWLGEYVLDDEEFKPSPDSDYRTTVGEYVEGLLSQDKYYNTVLPRLPMVTKRHVEERLAPLGQNRKRMKANKEIIETFRDPGTKIEANIGGDWLAGTLIELEEDVPTRPKARIRLDDGSEEYVHLGKVIISERGRRSRSRGRRPPGGGGGSGGGGGGYGRSRSRSPRVDWSRDKGRSDRELIDELRNREREKAVCSSGKDYARKPVGYKAACALPREQGAASYRLMEEETFVPMSRQRRARTPSPEREGAGRRPSAEHQARMQQLFEKYGNAKGSTEERRADDGVDRPDVMRLG